MHLKVLTLKGIKLKEKVLKRNMNGSRKKRLVTFTVIVFLLGLCNAFGQNYRIAYDYVFKKDSTDINSIDKEIMFLDTNKGGSVFYSYPKFMYDSLTADRYHKNKYSGDIDFSNISDKSKIAFSVEKKYADNEVVLNTILGIQKYTVVDDTPIKWQIVPERNTYKEFNVQKAVCDFGGRKWIAWYTTDIPLLDGPYKFWGLPGLILKIEDTKKDHVFEFMGIQKMQSTESYFYQIYKPEKEKISNKQFNLLWKEYKKDPGKNSKMLLYNSGTDMKISWNGRELNKSEMIRNVEKNAQQNLIRNNNFLEISLYK
ncbi:GLPGLI family protein [Elizabethkingia anophelis]|nr:GLPGLI family protein [Elizabethkingia anophelis]